MIDIVFFVIIVELNKPKKEHEKGISFRIDSRKKNNGKK